VLVQFQLPMTDLRAFASGQRLVLPTWPTPEPKRQFIRYFGAVKKRGDDGLMGWPGEISYCDSKRAIRVPLEERRGSSGCYWKPKSMRLYSDGTAMTKLELYFKPMQAHLNVRVLVSDLLNVRIRVRGTNELVRLFECGRAISSLYQIGTARSDCRSNQGTLSVHEEMPCVFVAAGAGGANLTSPNSVRQYFGIPFNSKTIVLPGLFQETRVFRWYSESRTGQIRTFAMIVNESPFGSEARKLNRQLRLYILRLNAESSTLRRVLEYIALDNPDSEAQSVDSTRLREYLHNKIEKMERSWKRPDGFPEDEPEVADAFDRVFSEFFADEIGDLRAQVEVQGQLSITRREFIPPSAFSTEPKELTTTVTEEKLLLPEQAIPLLRTQLKEAVETLRHNDPDVDGWERVTLRIVECAFGAHSRNAKYFAVTLSKARQSDEEAQAWHIENIKSKKGMLRAFIKELEIIPPHLPLVDDDHFARMAVDEARKSTAEDEREHPMVGCVVVRDGQVLATSHRGEMEGCHAEFIALEKKLRDATLTGCTVYTTLEPCTTRNHPKIPCAERLIARKVARVVYGMLDPDPRICGKGIRKLQERNIEVKWFPHELVMELEELNRHFTHSVAESGVTTGQAQKEKERVVMEKRKLLNLLRKINGIQCDFRFPPGPQDPCFNTPLIQTINKDIESIRDALVELLDLPEAQALADVRIPTPPLGSVSWSWLEVAWKEHFLPVQQIFRGLKAEVLPPAPDVEVSDKWVDLTYPVNHLVQQLGLGPNVLAWCRDSKVPGLIAQGTAEVVHEPDSTGQPHRLRIKTSPEPLMLIRRIPPRS